MTVLNKKSLHAVVEHLLLQGGTRLAIEAGETAERRLDYAALERRSRQLAWALKARGIGPGTVVALPLPASVDYVIAMLATIRAGGIFLPLDPAYPAARLRQIFSLARPQLLLVRDAEKPLGEQLAALATPPLEILGFGANDSGDADTAAPLPISAGDDDTGYLIHTSGSTGTPKLIAGRNKGISHFVHWEVAELGIDATVRASLFSPPSFDVSLREILVPLLAGGTLVIPQAEVRTDAARLADWLRTQRITLMHAVPSLFRLLTRALRDAAGDNSGDPASLPELRHACLAGEPLYGADVAAWRAVAGNGAALINLYGPSETTLAKAFHRVDGETYAPGAIVPIGQPIANAALLVLRDGQLADIGAIGEIHIRTPFASNGYWGAPELSAESFIANPLATTTGTEATDRIYRTGDLGRYRPDRSVEFVGRADRQVKIDGVRIELAEIEGALRAHAGVDEVAAHVFRLADGSAQLVGYHTSRAPVAAEDLRAHLETLLPAAMIPGYLVCLPALPKNLNGKVDRKALPRPEALLAADRAYSAPRGAVETSLAALWADALGVDRVGVESPWLTVGGNSLRAIGLIGRINRECGVALAIRDFLEHGTIRAQARLIARQQADATPPLTRAADSADADYPLTDQQRRLWILSRLEDGQALYNNTEWLELAGPLDVAALQQAFQTLVDRHESLRTVFIANADGEPRQRILPTLSVALPCSDLAAAATPATTAAAALQAALAHERGTAFDLAQGPLLRLALLRESPERHHLLINIHHIVCDGWSMGLLVPELAAAYKSALAGRQFAAPLPEFRPRDIAVWLAGLAASPAFARCRDYWRTQLADADARAVLPTDQPAPPGDRFTAAQVPIVLPAASVAALRQLLAERQATPFMAVAAALAALLFRYGGREQVVIGTPVAGRERPGMEAVVGFCVNTLPLVLRLAPDLSFAALLAQAGRAVAGLHAHQDLPFDQLIAEFGAMSGDISGNMRDPFINPLFEVFLAAEPAPRDLGLPGIRVTEHEPPCPPARYDLALRFADAGASAEWRLILEYRQTLWRPETMTRFARHFGNWLAAAVAAPDLPLAALPMLDSAELQQLAAWAKGPQRPLPEQTLGELFARQAARTPDAPALLAAATTAADPLVTVSYAALDRRANGFAQALGENYAVRPGDVVGLLLPRDTDWPAALLGILKIGATVLPLDPRHPPARLAELLGDAAARVLIAPPTLFPGWADGPRLDPAEVARAAAPPHRAVAPDAAAYLIYTSGSTGAPKGVLVSHRAFANMIADQIDALGVGAGDRVLQFVAPAFDVALFEVFLALLSGATLAIPDRDEAEEATGYARWVERLDASVIMLTPGFLHALGDTPLPGVRLVISGGETPIATDVQRCLAAGKRYVNAYGPTETAVNAALCEIAGAAPLPAPIPLGRPTANCELRVVAPDLSPLPVGIPGELLIVGPGVALGYLHRQALSARVFGHTAENLRYYRSGDRARRDAGGALVFLGRADGQIKVRGHRIETGEVEAAIKAVPDIGAVRVIARPLGADHELVAYWIAGTETAAIPDTATLRSALAARLPAYAVPSHFIRLERFPLNGNGKLDIKRLPDPHSTAATPCATPRTPLEATLAALWREVLELPESVPLGRDSDFFALGGRSLAANRLALRVARALERPVSLRDLYAAPTPAALLERLADTALATIPRLPESAPAPLAPMQRRLWIISRLGESGAVYHIAGLTRLGGELDVAALRTACADLCARQSVLRSRIVVSDAGEPQQVVDAPAAPPFSVHMEGEAPPADPAMLAAQPFDLAREWPLRVHLWPRGAQAWDLLIVIHHLAGDGWSMPIFVRELTHAYNVRHAGRAPDWQPLPLQYRDVAAWLDRQMALGVHAADAAYWRAELAGELPLLDLPTDQPRPAVRGYRGATHGHPLPASSVRALGECAGRHATTPFAVFLAAVQMLLARLSRQDDIIVGVPLAGRDHPASEGLIGFFVNTLPLRAHFPADAGLPAGVPFRAHLAATAGRLVLAQQHQAYPFDRLVEDLDLPRDTARSPVFDVLVSLDEQASNAPAPTLDGLTATELPLDRSGARCDLWWMVDLTGPTPALRVEYDSDLFAPATVADWCERLLHLIDAAHAAPETAVGALPWLSPAERNALLERANPPSAAAALPAGTVIDRFEAMAAAHPEAIALVEDQGSWRYGELDRTANLLAHQLAARLAEQAGHPMPRPAFPIIALMVERGAPMAVAMLATLKAGAAYLPIEPDSPAERIQTLIADAGASLLLVSPEITPPPLPDAVLVLPLMVAPTEQASAPPARQTTADDPIYVMYTSGSTGRPKGVVVAHRAVLRLVIDTDYYRPAADDRLLQLSNYAFDGATFDFFAAFAHGLPLCLPDRETVLDTGKLVAFMRRHRVNVSFVTTALLNRLVDTDATVLGQFRRLYFGGQEASLPHVRRAHAATPVGALVHVYGPTEVTTFATWHTVRDADLGDAARRLPIGRPIANTRAYVLDERGEPQPMGVPGELWLGGPGVAHGYLGQPALTAERFSASRFVAGDRLYRSGDLCLMRRDGTLEFLGRLDGQVKIRGYRVELGEIEGRLAAVAGVGKAHVLARPGSGGNLELVAYLTAQDPAQAPTRAALHGALARWLPPYMIPAHFVLLPQLPVNANGKIDRRALPEPQPGMPGLLNEATTTDAPRDAAQSVLWETWRAVLGLAEIGMRDNYFSLGGDSIQALQIVSRLRQAGWTLKVTDLLRTPTIEGLAPLLTQTATPADSPAAVLAEDREPPLSPTQHWFLAQDFARPAHFNQSLLLVIAPDLASSRLQEAIAALWRHHPGLRLVFGQQGMPAPWQRQLPPAPAPAIETVVCADAAALLADAQARQRRFDPATGPLFAAVRYRLPAEDRLFLVAHHWIIDGVSWRTLLADLQAALAGRPLPPAGATLGAWTRGLAATTRCDDQRAWWHAQATAPAALLPRLPGNAPQAPLRQRRLFDFVLPATATDALTATGHAAYQTQGDELLLAAWVLALIRVTNALATSDASAAIRLTLETHGRAPLLDGVDIARTVGWFTALFPLRFAVSSLALPTLIREVKETLRALPERGVGYGVLRWLRHDPVLAAATPPEIGFNYLGRFDQDAALPVAPEPTGDELAAETVLPHGIDLTAEIRAGQLHARLVADVGRHAADWCERLCSDYAAALQEIARHCLDPAAGALSPSDVDLDGINLAELDAILDGLGKT